MSGTFTIIETREIKYDINNIDTYFDYDILHYLIKHKLIDVNCLIEKDILINFIVGMAATFKREQLMIDIPLNFYRKNITGKVTFEDLLIELIKKGAKLNVPNSEGWYILPYIIQMIPSASPIVKFMMEHGLDLKNDLGNSLKYAIENKDIKTSKLLIKYDVFTKRGIFENFIEIQDNTSIDFLVNNRCIKINDNNIDALLKYCINSENFHNTKTILDNFKDRFISYQHIYYIIEKKLEKIFLELLLEYIEDIVKCDLLCKYIKDCKDTFIIGAIIYSINRINILKLFLNLKNDEANIILKDQINFLERKESVIQNTLELTKPESLKRQNILFDETCK